MKVDDRSHRILIELSDATWLDIFVDGSGLWARSHLLPALLSVLVEGLEDLAILRARCLAGVEGVIKYRNLLNNSLFFVGLARLHEQVDLVAGLHRDLILERAGLQLLLGRYATNSRALWHVVQDHLFDLLLVHLHLFVAFRRYEGPGNDFVIHDLHLAFVAFWSEASARILKRLLAHHLDALSQSLLESTFLRWIYELGARGSALRDRLLASSVALGSLENLSEELLVVHGRPLLLGLDCALVRHVGGLVRTVELLHLLAALLLLLLFGHGLDEVFEQFLHLCADLALRVRPAALVVIGRGLVGLEHRAAAETFAVGFGQEAALLCLLCLRLLRDGVGVRPAV